MAKIHEYKGKDGYYVRDAQGGRISTYQVTPEGVQVLRQAGRSDGDSLARAELGYMISNGFVYTGGSRPDRIDQELSIASTSRTYSPRVNSFSKASLGASIDPEVLTFVLVVAFVLAGGLGIIFVVLTFNNLCVLLFQVVTVSAFLFMPFGLLGGVLTQTKNRSFGEGYWWGQLTGPVGIIVVTFLPAVGWVKRPAIEPEPLSVQNADGFLTLFLTSLLVILLIILLMAAVVIASDRKLSQQAKGYIERQYSKLAG